VLGTTTSRPASRAALQKQTDLILLADGLTLVAPALPTLGLNATRWPVANRRATRIYLTSQTATTFAALLNNVTITSAYTAAVGSGSGQSIGPVQAGQVYAFQTAEATPRNGVMLVVSVPVSTATTTTTGLQLQVRMAKQPL
jgi:Tfp pilus assembly protein PilN